MHMARNSETATSNQRISKAQKRRDAKHQQSLYHERLIAETDAQSANSDRTRELDLLAAVLNTKSLCMIEIVSDGDCMYNAVGHQLKLTSRVEKNASELRHLAADVIRENESIFLPYINENQSLHEYCKEIEHTKVWGGELELKALSTSFQKPIIVVQADGREVCFGEEYKTNAAPSLTIVYMKHALSAGAHYNSTQPILATLEC